MLEFHNANGHTQVLIPLRVLPYAHKAVPTLTGSAFSSEAGTVLFGHYNMEYLLPQGDRLRLIANHHKKSVQLLLFTHNAEIIKKLPGQRPSSLVADTISTINRYIIKSSGYIKPFTPEQLRKRELAKVCIKTLSTLLSKERELASDNHYGHEKLRKEVIATIEQCRDDNKLIAINPIVSEGSFGKILYEAHQAAQHYQFNRVYPVSPQDQLDFTDPATHNGKAAPCFVWDSELHNGHDGNFLDDAIRTLCKVYHLTPAAELNNIPANRFEKMEAFFHKLWQDGHDWIEYLAVKNKPTHNKEVHKRRDGMTITTIQPYYELQGFSQKSYASLKDMVFNLTKLNIEGIQVVNSIQANKTLRTLPNGHWVIIANENKLLLRLENKIAAYHYFHHQDQYYPLPDGDDLYTLSQVSKRHLYLPERLSLQLNGFVSRLPVFFKNFFKSLKQFIIQDLHQEFIHHVHAGHVVPEAAVTNKSTEPQENKTKSSLHEALVNNGFLSNGETLEQFIKTHINNSPYVIVRGNHPPSPPAYENPLHRALSVFRHIGAFFVDTSERNPIIGTLATAAYFYGGGAVLAPKALESLLAKLHLNGLIAGIEPTQRLGRWMSHGAVSEAISAAVTLWQGTVAGGNLDKFFTEAIRILKDDPGQVAIVTALALGLGYGITKAIPSLQHEMGDFPLPNYAALGAKGGAAIYDTVMHPGDDWLLGTCKWFCKGVITLSKLVISPFVEAYHYGAKQGFLNGWKKSGRLFVKISKQILAACVDVVLAALTMPLLEFGAVLVHVPFRGVTHFFSKLLSTIGNLSILGQVLMNFARRPSSNNFLSEFRLSPLYGFSSPLGTYASNKVLNVLINILRVIFIPPLQLLKNILILPVIDIMSLILRVLLTILNPLSRVLTYPLGYVLFHIGQVWDNSFGVLFSASAEAIILLSNWIDKHAGNLKQTVLALIETIRGELYSWAFSEEDRKLHSVLDEQEYYTSHPMRCEKIPHQDSHCLIRTLLNEDTTVKVNNEAPPPATVSPPKEKVPEIADEEILSLRPMLT